MEQAEGVSLLAQQDAANKAAAAAAASATASLSNLSQNGAPLAQFASRTYGWSDLDMTPDDVSMQDLTNEQCAAFEAYYNSTQSTLKQKLAKELAKELAVAAGGYQFTLDIHCTPKYTTQTRSDQAAVFVVQGLKIGGLYTLFPNTVDVEYTVGNPNHLLKGSDATAPLGTNRVRVALEHALYRVFLAAYSSYLSL